jgi:hypothetical protein
MIRYIRIGDQINDGSDDFSFFDTVKDEFVSFNGEQVFSSIDDFEMVARKDDRYGRCKALIPEHRTQAYGR